MEPDQLVEEKKKFLQGFLTFLQGTSFKRIYKNFKILHKIQYDFIKLILLLTEIYL